MATSVATFARNDLLFTMSDNTRDAHGSVEEQTRNANSCFHGRAFQSFDGIAAGGARRDRTDDLMLAKHALSQLSYGPFVVCEPPARGPSRQLGAAFAASEPAVRMSQS